MASTIAQIRDALKTRLATISGLEVHDTAPGQINPPCAVIRRRRGPRADDLGASRFEYVFVVTLFTSLGDDTSGQDDLDAFLAPTGSSSILAAIEADSDLGSTVEWAAVTDAEEDQIIEYAGVSYLGADVLVTVGAS